jgi:hypothetical protein
MYFPDHRYTREQLAKIPITPTRLARYKRDANAAKREYCEARKAFIAARAVYNANGRKPGGRSWAAWENALWTAIEARKDSKAFAVLLTAALGRQVRPATR